VYIFYLVASQLHRAARAGVADQVGLLMGTLIKVMVGAAARTQGITVAGGELTCKCELKSQVSRSGIELIAVPVGSMVHKSLSITSIVVTFMEDVIAM